MLSILTNKYVLGAIAAFAIFASILFYGNQQYNAGYDARDLKAQAEMLEFKNKIAQETTEVLNRSNAAARQAQIQQQTKIQELVNENQQLERIIEENENEANIDENRNRIGLDPSSVLRLNKIR